MEKFEFIENNYETNVYLTPEQELAKKAAADKKILELNGKSYLRSIFIVFVLTFIIGFNNNFDKLPFQNFNEGNVFYTRMVSEAEVGKLGRYLMKSGFFDGNPKSVKIDRNDNFYIFSAVIKKEYRNDSQYTDGFKLLTYEISELFGSKTIIKLCDERFNAFKTINYDDGYRTLEINSTKILYSPSIPKKNIQDLAKHFIFEKIIDGTPKSFILKATHKNDILELLIPVKAEYKNNKIQKLFFEIIQGNLIFNVLKKKINVTACDTKTWKPYYKIRFYDALMSFEMNENKFAYSQGINETVPRKIADILSEAGLFDDKDSCFVLYTHSKAVPNICIYFLKKEPDENFIKNVCSKISKECLDNKGFRMDIRDKKDKLIKSFYQTDTNSYPLQFKPQKKEGK